MNKLPPHKFNLDDNRLLISRAQQPQLFSTKIIHFLETSKQLKRLKGGEFNFFDIGCGTGELSSLLCSNFAGKAKTKALFLDPLPEAVSLARKWYGRNCSMMKQPNQITFLLKRFEDVSRSDYQDISRLFDFILCSHVFYYFSDWQEMIRRISSLLTPHGMACLIIKDDRGTRTFDLRKQIFKHLNLPLRRNLQTAENMEKNLKATGVAWKSETFRYDAVLPVSDRTREAVAEDVMRILRFVFHFPLHEFVDDRQIFRMLSNFITENTRGDAVRITMKDVFFWCFRG